MILCDFNIYDNDIFFNDDNINFSNGLAEVVFNNHELGNFNNDDLNFIFFSEPKQGEINDKEITYSLWKYKNEINDNVKIEIKNVQYKILKVKDKNRKKNNIPDLERLLFIHDKILTELNYLCMIDNLKNNLPIGIIYNISKFI